MAEEFCQSILIKVVAQICKMVGFDKIMTTPLEVLVDILKRFILKIGRLSLHYGEHCGRSEIGLRDLALAFSDCRVLPGELTEFLTLVGPLPKSIPVPKFPVFIKNSNTSFDSPGVDENEVENTLPDSGEDLNSSRETLKIKISLSKIKEARDAKKSKNKKNKQKRKKRKIKENFK